jgi:hypothetical protein
MTPGTVLFNPHFQFTDGEIGRKYLVVLSEGASGFYIAIKTTSRQKNKGNDEGCQSSDRPPNFYVLDGSWPVQGESWFLLEEFYELESGELERKVSSGQIEVKGNLSNDMLIELLACAVASFDITESQLDILQRILSSL